MKRYCIKSHPGESKFLDILSENEDGYGIRITSVSDGNEKIREDYIARNLFDICLKTGYLSELAAAHVNYSAA